jgi:dTDP-4-amino-4,6-dideoxygalactose transaminase/predicted dehydrogenase
VLAEPSIQAVAVATQPSTHHDLAKRALLAGKHVFVEKPLAMEIGHAEELADLARRLGRRLMVGHILQYHPAFSRLQSLIATGVIGRVLRLQANRMNLGAIRLEEDVLWCLGPHDVSIILAIVGAEPSEVQGVGGYHLRNAIADAATLHLTFPAGEQAQINLSWLNPVKEHRLTVIGTEAMIVLDDGAPWERKLLLYRHSVNVAEHETATILAEPLPVPVEANEPLKRECQHFIDCIVQGRDPITNGDEGLRVMRVLARASMAMNAGHGGQAVFWGASGGRRASEGHETAAPSQIPFTDLGAQRRRLGQAVDEAVRRVLDHGAYIMGPEVAQLEADLSAFCGARHAISCGSGTDALVLILMAKGVKAGDAVFCPSFTFAATAEAIALLGATPIFVDILPDTFNFDVGSLRPSMEMARGRGLNPVGIITVDLFGQPADYDRIEAAADREGLWLLCDAAQSFGASYKGRQVGTIGLATAASFYPAKPLGGYGDGGAVFTDDGELADIIRSLRIHGQGADKYDNVRIGMNGRLDTLQAAILIEKLKIFPEEIAARNRIASRYNEQLRGIAAVPNILANATSVWAQYTLRLPGFDRGAFQAFLAAAGIPTAVHYPKPLHRQAAYKHFPAAPNGLPVSERLAAEVVSLPMHPYLTEDVQDRVTVAVRAALAAQA